MKQNENLMAQLVLLVRSGMNSRQRKILIVWFIAFVLIYYSAAWAILRCYHDDDHASSEIQASQTGSSAAEHGHIVIPGEAENIDCTAFDFHTESLNAPTSAPQLSRSLVWFNPEFPDVAISNWQMAGFTPCHLATIFTRGSPSSTFLDTPLYLFLSSLRI